MIANVAEFAHREVLDVQRTIATSPIEPFPVGIEQHVRGGAEPSPPLLPSECRSSDVDVAKSPPRITTRRLRCS